MTAVVICEKSTQAANVREAVGTKYGEVFAAQGHLLRLQEPDEVNPDWKAWTTAVLLPPGGRYGYVPDASTKGKAAALARIKDALKSASEVIIATDCDREGQAIGESLIRHFGYRGTVRRAMFSAEDPQSLREAFAACRPNAEFAPLYNAAVARQQADQIFNLSLTRAATVLLRPPGAKGVVGIGRVKTATMAIAVMREKEIAAFRVSDYFELVGTVAGDAGQAALRFRPKPENRIRAASDAASICAKLAGFSGPLSVDRQRKTAKPPLPMSLPILQQRAGVWGWEAKKTAEVLQSLYETHKITTYPRAEARHLPEPMADEARPMVAALAALPGFGALGAFEPVIRKGRGGIFSDAALAGTAHHGVVPNPKTISTFKEVFPRLSDDEKKLFGLIAKAFLAAVAPDYIFDETVLSLETNVKWCGDAVTFKASGRVTVSAGWRAIMTPEPETDTKHDDDKDDPAKSLPSFLDGTRCQLLGITTEAKQTKPPPRYSEGTLIGRMENAYQFVSDPQERERLKGAKGIGTPATRDDIIEGLKSQGFFTLDSKKLIHASDMALSLYDLLNVAAPALVDPASTARMEQTLDAVQSGGKTVDAVISDVAVIVAGLIQSIEAQGGRLSIKSAPSPAMIEAAKREATKRGLAKLPPGVATDFEACQAFLGPRVQRNPAAGPSEAQLGFAEKLAADNGLDLPADVAASGSLLSAWLDAAIKKAPPRLASEKQLTWITKLVDEGTKAPPGFPDNVTADTAKSFLDKAFAKKGKK